MEGNMSKGIDLKKKKKSYYHAGTHLWAHPASLLTKQAGKCAGPSQVS